jgi:hypothetical protein
MNKNPQQKQIQVQLDEKAAEGTYSNFVLTAHTNSEFILDFARTLPGLNKAKVFSRIIMTPQSAKRLYQVMEQTLTKFEDKFGEIKLPGNTNSQGIGFQAAPPASTGQQKRR